MVTKDSKYDIYTSSPMGKAVLDMFSQLGDTASKLYPEAGPGAIRAYIFGGAAVHLYTKSRGSHDVDAEIHGAEKLQPQDLLIDYDDEEGSPQSLIWDSNFNTSLGPLHEDYVGDAVRISHDDSDILWVYIVSPDDLAVSKLGRFAEHDREDIISLVEKGLISVSSLEKRANEAFSYYVGNVESAKVSLDIVLKDIE